jgi:hypothetical protein
MDIRANPFYFFSGERASRVLPARARFVRVLPVTGGDMNREVALVELEAFDSEYPPRYVAVCARHANERLFNFSDSEPLFVNVFAEKGISEWNSVDLSKPDLAFVDVGGICASESVARKWQFFEPNERK